MTGATRGWPATSSTEAGNPTARGTRNGGPNPRTLCGSGTTGDGQAACTRFAGAAGMRIQRILCAVDFSDCSAAALRVGAELAKESDATLILVHAFFGPTIAYEIPHGIEDMVRRLESEAEQGLVDWRRQAESYGATRIETVAIHGQAAEEIVRMAASRDIDLIVTGTHGRSSIKHLLLGSVAEKVVRTAPCSVLVARAR